MAIYFDWIVAATDSQFLAVLLRLEFRGNPLTSVNLQAPMSQHILLCDLDAVIRNLTNDSDLWSIGNMGNFIRQSVRLRFPRARVLAAKFLIGLEPSEDSPTVRHILAEANSAQRLSVHESSADGESDFACIAGGTTH